MSEEPKVGSTQMEKDLVMLVRRLVQRLRKYNTSDPVASSAVDYLIRHDKGGSILERQVER
jgi:hypothetical protein